MVSAHAGRGKRLRAIVAQSWDSENAQWDCANSQIARNKYTKSLQVMLNLISEVRSVCIMYDFFLFVFFTDLGSKKHAITTGLSSSGLWDQQVLSPIRNITSTTSQREINGHLYSHLVYNQSRIWYSIYKYTIF